jgi:hypothetical protein
MKLLQGDCLEVLKTLEDNSVEYMAIAAARLGIVLDLAREDNSILESLLADG